MCCLEESRLILSSGTMAVLMSSYFSQAVSHTMQSFLSHLFKLLDLMDSVWLTFI